MVQERRECELLVVGAGPGGYVAAIRAGQLGIETTLVDRDAIGGTCLNYGCIPSKALLTATGRVAAVSDAKRMGIEAEPTIDFERLLGWKDGVVNGLTDGVETLCRTHSVDFLDGEATFLDDTTARINTGDGEIDLSFDAAIIATGSRPTTVPNFDFDGERVHSSRSLLSLSDVPDELVVVGAGYIGLELTTVFARLGTSVTVVEMMDEALPGYDEDLTRPVVRRLRDLGVSLEFGESALDWRENGDDITVFTESDDGIMAEYNSDCVLIAVGRVPVTDGLGLDEIGIPVTERGFIETDEYGRTDAESIFAVGDVAGEPLLAHKASHQGVVAAEAVAGEDVASPTQPIPAVVFTDPEIGSIGRTAADVANDGGDPVVGEFPFGASGRALTRNESDGFVRLVGDANTGEILGAQVVGAEVSELLGEIGVAMRAGLTLEELAGTVHTHPTLSESVMEAAANAVGTSIHVGN